MVSVFDRIRQAFCGFHGHDALLQFERDRMYLKCYSCGHESPGWDVKQESNRTVVRTADVPRRLVRPRLVNVRRVA